MKSFAVKFVTEFELDPFLLCDEIPEPSCEKYDIWLMFSLHTI